MSTRRRASLAGPLVTLTPGISRRNCCVSPLPRSSTPTTSLMGSSAGTSSRKRRVAVSMRVFASSAIARVIRGGRARRLDLVALQELSPDDHALDLGGALADEQQRRVTVET